jgi:hypothetical protein
MKRRRSQEGQALIAALVAMVVLFSVAGGLAVAVSAALDSGSSGGTYLRDVKAQSSSSAVLATVAGSPGTCPTGTLFGKVSGYGCDHIDAISPSRPAMVKLAGGSSCATAPLPVARHMAVWLHLISGAATLRVDASPSCGGSSACDAGSGSPSGNVFLYAIRDCALAGLGTAYVHVSNPSGSAAVARYAPLASLLPKFNAYPVGSAPAPILAVRLRGAGQPLDLLVGNRGGGVTLLQGQVGGNFANVGTYLSSTPVSAMTLADLEGNGSQYLAVASALRGTVTLLRNSGGNLQLVRVISFPWSHPPTSIVAAHFTGSNNLDLVVASLTGRSITVLPGNGDGTFQVAHRFLLNYWSPVALAVVDQPWAGGAMVAVATAETSLRIYGLGGNGNCGDECDGDGGNQAMNKLKLVGAHDLGGIPTAMAADNLFGHPYPDLAVTTPGRVSLFLGHPNGDVSPAGSIGVGSLPSAIIAGDLGGGGLADLAVTDAATNTVTAFLNNNGTFQPALGGPADTGAQPSGLAAGDFNGSGVGGLAITNGAANSVSVLFRNRSRVFTVVGAGPARTTSDEMDLVWDDLAPTNTLTFNGGLG